MVCLFYSAFLIIQTPNDECWVIIYVDLGQRRVPSWSCDQKVRWYGNLDEKYVNTDKAQNKQSWLSSMKAA